MLEKTMPKAIKIYHNPACGTSRNTLALIRNTGQEPLIIEYLKTPPSKEQLIKLIRESGLSIREALRKNVESYENLKLEKLNGVYFSTDKTKDKTLNFITFEDFEKIINLIISNI